MVPLLMTVPESLSNSLKTPQPPGKHQNDPLLIWGIPAHPRRIPAHVPRSAVSLSGPVACAPPALHTRVPSR